MKTLLAVICFVAAIVHGFFGYYLHVRGENVFYPEAVVVNQINVDSIQKDAFEAPKIVDSQVAPEEKAQTSETSDSFISKASQKANQELAKAASALNDFAQIGSEYQATSPKVEHPDFNTGWSGFLQVENALITAFLFVLGICVLSVKGRGAASRWVFLFNFLFWGVLTLTVWFFHPVKTPLAVLRLTFQFPEWLFVVAGSAIATLLSFGLYFNAYRRPLNYQAAPAVTTEKPIEPAVQDVTPETVEEEPQPKEEKKGLFNLKRFGRAKAEEATSVPEIKEPVAVTESSTVAESVEPAPTQADTQVPEKLIEPNSQPENKDNSKF